MIAYGANHIFHKVRDHHKKKEIKMKRRIVALFAATVVTIAATSAFATIKNTKHDMSTSHTGQTGGTDQVCKYCHTPHNAAVNIPLWNRTNPAATTFQFYSSPTMSLHRSVANTGTFEAESISLFCMSCHDGGAIGARMHNGASALVGNTTPSATVPNLTGDAITATAKANLSTDLRNDHPVNLRLANAVVQNQIFATAADRRTIGNGLTTKLPLFKGSAGDGYIECGSCHAVHNSTIVPFLRTTNKGSLLCLACHDK